MADLATLQPFLVPWAKALHEYGRKIDGRLVVTSARRTQQEQMRLYHRWKLGLSRIMAAPPGHSLHEHGLAFDMARIGIDPIRDPLLAWLGRVWAHWGGQWGTAADPVHFQVKLTY